MLAYPWLMFERYPLLCYVNACIDNRTSFGRSDVHACDASGHLGTHTHTHTHTHTLYIVGSYCMFLIIFSSKYYSIVNVSLSHSTF